MFKRSTKIQGAFILEPKVFKDQRGFFLESWNKETFETLGLNFTFVQDNHSRSSKYTLRGLHFQTGDAAQGKLVTVTTGVVFDVFVDLRVSSPTFGVWDGYYLSDTDHKSLWVPPGCAHGFVVLSDIADFQYKCTGYYEPGSERTLLWNDLSLNISWPIPKNTDLIISEKDKNGLVFDDCEKYL